MANILRYRTASDEAFNDLFRGFFMSPVRFDGQQDIQIKVEVAEDDKAYTVHAEIPGVKKEDIRVTVDGNQVAISAEVKNEKEVKEGGKVLRSERYYGTVSRSLALAQEVDDSAVVAKYVDGILELNLPKRTVEKAKQISIQ
ncbi:Hsp20/alpha crystallin family protein [Propionivibrio sp.]|uniref:Hsp20/alpha crystallin family protein n=1 Tax=Propionivibrio sp. TaxID=2212460 RepID=UPI0025D7A0AD|nr:Hsp20/alpha crystallin family protein [Propionivibrio sp.]MBK7356423.1 Hsp20/alpha crystallin family protein [Propionivibrio sp.]MBK8400110.1 Hsp20/alpha crystallin family protein [Propionivibrio sp.]MBK8744648.1 Hsp20/alpha crystallin family protein [Propionivibrio sp.]MBK8893800.1 Hsp20/alpha crystallin family protein [Propionivibrio sp.]MBL0207928.1 Hsp20/alpha crystallin family protein [Propionivibrio sp.]